MIFKFLGTLPANNEAEALNKLLISNFLCKTKYNYAALGIYWSHSQQMGAPMGFQERTTADFVEDMKGELIAAFDKARWYRTQFTPLGDIPPGQEENYKRHLQEEIAYGTFLASAIDVLSRPAPSTPSRKKPLLRPMTPINPSTKALFRELWEDKECKGPKIPIKPR